MAVLVDLRFMIIVCGELANVTVGQCTGGAKSHVVIDLMLAAQYFAQMRKNGLSAVDQTERSCHKVAYDAGQATLPSNWTVGSRPVLYDHIYYNEGWEPITGEQFGFAFPLQQAIPGGGFQDIVQTLQVEPPGGGRKQNLLARYVVQVQKSAS